MKGILFFALVAAALAHWPYANNEDRFRTSSLTIHGSATQHRQYFWIFYPLNNQMQPTFQLKFPERDPMVTYTLQLSHVAEVIPNGGTFNLVQESMVPFSAELWAPEPPLWFFDEETFGEVIELEFNPDAADGRIDGWLVSTIIIRIYPDSLDDLVDILVYLQDYHFVHPESFLAVFWKLASSHKGSTDSELPAAMPLSVEFHDLTFELDADIHVNNVYNHHDHRNSVARKPFAAQKKKVRKPSLHRKAMLDMKQRSFERKVSTKRGDWPEESTSGQLWFTGGYIATVFGQYPGQLKTGLDIASTVTIALRTLHLRV